MENHSCRMEIKYNWSMIHSYVSWPEGKVGSQEYPEWMCTNLGPYFGFLITALGWYLGVVSFFLQSATLRKFDPFDPTGSSHIWVLNITVLPFLHPIGDLIQCCFQLWISCRNQYRPSVAPCPTCWVVKKWYIWKSCQIGIPYTHRYIYMCVCVCLCLCLFFVYIEILFTLFHYFSIKYSCIYLSIYLFICFYNGR